MSKQTILAADDDAAIRALLEDVLSEPAGWQITTVSNGHALLAALDTLRPHLILLDVNMPGLSGLEVYRRLRACPDLTQAPVLFVSAASRPCATALDDRAGWLAKPFAIGQLLSAAAALMGVAPPAITG